jgi:hypothetical protein
MKAYNLILILMCFYSHHLIAQNTEWKSITRADFAQKTLSYTEQDFEKWVDIIDSRDSTVIKMKINNKDTIIIWYRRVDSFIDHIDELKKIRVFIDKAGNYYLWENMSIGILDELFVYFESNFIIRPAYFLDKSNLKEKVNFPDPDCFLNPTHEMKELYHHMVVSNGIKDVMVDDYFDKHSPSFWNFLTEYYWYKNGMYEMSLHDVLYRVLNDEDVRYESINKQLQVLKKFFTDYPQIALDEYPQYIPPQIDYSLLIEKQGECEVVKSPNKKPSAMVNEDANSIKNVLFQIFETK